MLGHNTYRSKKTKNKKIIKILESQTGSCYLVNGKYVKKILDIFERDLEKYNKDQIWKSEYCNDQSWKVLQPIDKWYTFSDRICLQQQSFSDIEKKVVNYNL